jgi:hypothetical protein
VKKSAWFVAFLLALTAVPAFAQQGPPDGGPGGGPPDFTEMRKHMEDEIKQDMDVTDDQWKAIQPKLEKVEELNESLAGHHGPPRGPNDQADDEKVSPVEQAVRDLEDTLDKDNATDDQIKSKVEAVRKAKETATADLKAARKELREGLTVRQEAVLVARGILD